MSITHHTNGQLERTLGVVRNLGVPGRTRKLDLMYDQAVCCRSRPVGLQRNIASDPFSADIRVDLYGVRAAVVGLSGDRHV